MRKGINILRVGLLGVAVASCGEVTPQTPSQVQATPTAPVPSPGASGDTDGKIAVADDAPDAGHVEVSLTPCARIALDRLLERGLPETARPDVLKILERVDEDARGPLLHVSESLFMSRAFSPVTVPVRLAAMTAFTDAPMSDWGSLSAMLQDVLPGRPQPVQIDLIAAAVSAPTEKVVAYLGLVGAMLEGVRGSGFETPLLRTLAKGRPDGQRARFEVANQILWLRAESDATWPGLANQVAFLVAGSAEDSALTRYLAALLGIQPELREGAARGLAGLLVSRKGGEAEHRVSFLLRRPPQEFAVMTTAIGRFFYVPNRPDVLESILKLHEGVWPALLLGLAKRDADHDALQVLAAESPETQPQVLDAALKLLRGQHDRLTGEVVREAVARRHGW